MSGLLRQLRDWFNSPPVEHVMHWCALGDHDLCSGQLGRHRFTVCTCPCHPDTLGRTHARTRR